MKCKVCGNLLYGYETTCPDCGHKVEEQKRKKPYTLLSKRTLTTLMNRELPSETRGAYTHVTLSCAIAITALLLCLSLFYHVPPPVQASRKHIDFSFLVPQVLNARQGTIARTTALLANTGNVQLHWKIVVDHTTPQLSLSIRAGILLPQATQRIFFTIKTQHLALGSHIVAFQLVINSRGYRKTSIAFFVLPTTPTPPPDTSNGVKNAIPSYSPPTFKPTSVPTITPTTPLSPPKHTTPQQPKQPGITPTPTTAPITPPTSSKTTPTPGITPTPTTAPITSPTPKTTPTPTTPPGLKPGTNPASQQSFSHNT